MLSIVLVTCYWAAVVEGGHVHIMMSSTRMVHEDLGMTLTDSVMKEVRVRRSAQQNPDITGLNSTQKVDMVNKHNALRSAVNTPTAANMRYMVRT